MDSTTIVTSLKKLSLLRLTNIFSNNPYLTLRLPLQESCMKLQKFSPGLPVTAPFLPSTATPSLSFPFLSASNWLQKHESPALSAINNFWRILPLLLQYRQCYPVYLYFSLTTIPLISPPKPHKEAMP